MMKSSLALFSFISLGITLFGAQLRAEGIADTQSKFDAVVAQGVPAESLNRIVRFIKENQGRSVRSPIYLCRGQAESNVAPCSKEVRYRSTFSTPFKVPRYAAVADMTLPSTERRLFVIDLKTGQVEKFHVTHGRGSGVSKYASRFSNNDSSHQTSLGLYLVGSTYKGKYGQTLRLYGLENSNSIAYERDIVMHGAWYASAKAANNARLGLSFGCPAVDPKLMKKLIPILREGAILDIYHADLMKAAESGAPVQVKPPEAEDGILNAD